MKKVTTLSGSVYMIDTAKKMFTRVNEKRPVVKGDFDFSAAEWTSFVALGTAWPNNLSLDLGGGRVLTSSLIVDVEEI